MISNIALMNSIYTINMVWNQIIITGLTLITLHRLSLITLHQDSLGVKEIRVNINAFVTDMLVYITRIRQIAYGLFLFSNNFQGKYNE